MSELYYGLDGGTVTIEDGVKAAEEYAPARKVSVVLNWSPSQDAEPEEVKALFDFVGETASAKVAELLGRSATAVNTASSGAPATTGTRTRRTKEQIAADKAAEEAAKKAAETPAGGDVDFDVDAPSPQSSTGGSEGAAASGDVSFDLDVPAQEPTKELSDADLNSAVQEKNKEINNPAKIKELIATFRTDPTKPFNLTMIPQEARGRFIEKLSLLTA